MTKPMHLSGNENSVAGFKSYFPKPALGEYLLTKQLFIIALNLPIFRGYQLISFSKM